MTKVKESSTHQANKEKNRLECPVSYMLDKIGGNWKPIIIYHLLPGPRRYSELKKAIPAITEKMLLQQLKQLEADNLVFKETLSIKPLHVTYGLTPSGKDLLPVLKAMGEWAIKDSKQTPVDTYGLLEGLY